jgi:hypothetical protein
MKYYYDVDIIVLVLIIVAFTLRIYFNDDCITVWVDTVWFDGFIHFVA